MKNIGIRVTKKVLIIVLLAVFVIASTTTTLWLYNWSQNQGAAGVLSTLQLEHQQDLDELAEEYQQKLDKLRAEEPQADPVALASKLADIEAAYAAELEVIEDTYEQKIDMHEEKFRNLQDTSQEELFELKEKNWEELLDAKEKSYQEGWDAARDRYEQQSYQPYQPYQPYWQQHNFTTPCYGDFKVSVYDGEFEWEIDRFQENVINHDWSSGGFGGLTEDYSVKWSGDTNYLQEGRYQFGIVVSGRVKLYVDGNLIINKWGYQSSTTYVAERDLSEGSHKIILKYYNQTGNAVIKLFCQKIY